MSGRREVSKASRGSLEPNASSRPESFGRPAAPNSRGSRRGAPRGCEEPVPHRAASRHAPAESLQAARRKMRGERSVHGGERRHVLARQAHFGNLRSRRAPALGWCAYVRSERMHRKYVGVRRRARRPRRRGWTVSLPGPPGKGPRAPIHPRLRCLLSAWCPPQAGCRPVHRAGARRK